MYLSVPRMRLDILVWPSDGDIFMIVLQLGLIKKGKGKIPLPQLKGKGTNKICISNIKDNPYLL